MSNSHFNCDSPQSIHRLAGPLPTKTPFSRPSVCEWPLTACQVIKKKKKTPEKPTEWSKGHIPPRRISEWKSSQHDWVQPLFFFILRKSVKNFGQCFPKTRFTSCNGIMLLTTCNNTAGTTLKPSHQMLVAYIRYLEEKYHLLIHFTVCLWKGYSLHTRSSLLYRMATTARTTTTVKARMPTVIPRPALDPESGCLLDRAAHTTTTVRHILIILAIRFLSSVSDKANNAIPSTLDIDPEQG